MSDTIVLRAPQPLDATVRPPGSKSITNRALVLAGIARGRSRLEGALEADDTALMCGCLRRLGVHVKADGDVLEVEGADGAPRAAGVAQLDVGLAGTVARFITGIAAAGPGQCRIDGTERMRERPMSMLIDALREQGARIECLGKPGALPILVGPHTGSLRGGVIRLSRPASSQFISGLVIAATLAERETAIILDEGTPARPYVDMTLAALRDFGGHAEWVAVDEIVVQPGRLRGRTYAIEPDASGASYFLGLAAIYGGRVTIPGLGTASQQGDAGFVRVLGRMGAEVELDVHETQIRGTGKLIGGDFDLSDTPDMTPTLAVVAAHATGRTTISGVEVLRHHESDRIAALAIELTKLGVTVEERDDGLVIDPPADGPKQGVTVDSHGDHRMAMALSLVGDIAVRDPDCVAKTYPRYFAELRNLGMVTSRSE